VEKSVSERLAELAQMTPEDQLRSLFTDLTMRFEGENRKPWRGRYDPSQQEGRSRFAKRRADAAVRLLGLGGNR
jgi:hypothetical protein